MEEFEKELIFNLKKIVEQVTIIAEAIKNIDEEGITVYQEQ